MSDSSQQPQTYLCGHAFPTSPINTKEEEGIITVRSPKLPCITCVNIVRHSSGPTDAELALGPEIYERIGPEVVEEWLGRTDKWPDDGTVDKSSQNAKLKAALAREKSERDEGRVKRLEEAERKLMERLAARRAAEE